MQLGPAQGKLSEFSRLFRWILFFSSGHVFGVPGGAGASSPGLRVSDFIPVAREVKLLDSASDKLAESVLKAGLSCLLDAVASRPLSECLLGWRLPAPF